MSKRVYIEIAAELNFWMNAIRLMEESIILHGLIQFFGIFNGSISKSTLASITIRTAFSLQEETIDSKAR